MKFSYANTFLSKTTKYMTISHEEYIQKQRDRAVTLARGMLDGSIHYLEGTLELSSLREELSLTNNEPDFFCFTVISSEIDHLPIGKSRQYWSDKALEKYDLEIENLIEWAKDISLSNLKSIIERFGNQ
ncbi:MAG: DUF2489 domain-containing protein [Cellvibrio sp.]